MAAVAAVAGIVGAGIQVYGAITAANDQASLDDSRASIATQQATEIAGREQANESLRDQQAVRQKLAFGAAFSASGKAGSGVGSQLQFQNEADTQNMVSAREASFQESMLKQQAQIDSSLADETRQAGIMNAIGAGLKGVSSAGALATAGGSNPGFGGPQSLGSYPSAGGGSGVSSGLGDIAAAAR